MPHRHRLDIYVDILTVLKGHRLCATNLMYSVGLNHITWKSCVEFLLKTGMIKENQVKRRELQPIIIRKSYTVSNLALNTDVSRSREKGRKVSLFEATEKGLEFLKRMEELRGMLR